MSAQNLKGRIGTIAGAAILAVLLWRLGTGAFLDGLRRIDGPTLLAALGIGLFTTVLSAWRWCVVARGLNIKLPLGGAVADYYRALFLNAALPGGVLGDVHRAVRHGQNTGDIGRGVRAVVLERTAGQIVLLVAGVTILLTLPSPVLAVTRDAVASPLAAVVLAALCALGVAAAVRRRRKPATSRWRRAVRATLTEARTALLARGSWPAVVVSSVAVLAGHLAMFLVAARAAGSTAPFAELAPLMVLALLAMALPLNVGGWGPREGATAWAFGAAGLGAAQGLTVAVVYGVLAFAASLPGMLVLAGQWLVRLRRSESELEEGVLAEHGAPRRRTQRLTHHGRAREAQTGNAVAQQDRCDGDVQPVECLLVQEARHGDTAALDQHPAETAARQGLDQPTGGERVVVRQRQHVNTATAATDTVAHPLLVAAAGADHPQSGS